MTDEEAKNAWLELAAILRKYAPELLLTDARTFFFTIGKDCQAWLDENVAKFAIEMGLKKKANLISPDMFAQMSIELLLKRDTMKKGFQNQFFDNYEAAEKWLLQK